MGTKDREHLCVKYIVTNNEHFNVIKMFSKYIFPPFFFKMKNISEKKTILVFRISKNKIASSSKKISCV